MKSAPQAVRDGLMNTPMVWRADLITITPVVGSALHWTTLDLAMVTGGVTYAPSGIVRRTLRQAIFPEIDTFELAVAGTVQINGRAIARRALEGYFDEAAIQVDHIVMPAPGDISWGVIPKWFEGQISEVDPESTEVRLTAKGEAERLNLTTLPRYLFQPSCGHTVYDANCGLSRAALTTTGTVQGSTTVRTFSSTVTGHVNDYYNLGVVAFTSGALAGERRPVRDYTQSGGVFVLDFPLLSAPAAGDAFSVYPGCDRKWTTCRDKFGNTAAFRGFPRIPAPDGER